MSVGGAESSAAGPSPRLLRRERDGTLYDLMLDRPVTLVELAQDVKDGKRFRAVRAESGATCTAEVLLEVLRAALPEAAALTGLAKSAVEMAEQLGEVLGYPRSGSEADCLPRPALRVRNGGGLEAR